MEKQGVVVHYFLGLDAQPPLSAVQVFSLQHIRPMVAGETVKKIICHARVGDQGYPCIVLAVDHGKKKFVPVNWKPLEIKVTVEIPHPHCCSDFRAFWSDVWPSFRWTFWFRAHYGRVV
ncbi:hypothetical protein RvY_15709-1 [Ramazzottius varieornatus]|uniref:Uncharacterized protein n=1 Tax=Ramazzottius varieornatus TaxID=947166 RepID=A0A1D1W0G7_RAMVA|nr:hypothetical protein RvY_15709-1 [Ramazzottius varieornatus]